MNKMRKCVGVLGLCCLLLLTGLLSGCGQMVEAGGHYCGPTQMMWNGEIYRSTGTARFVMTSETRGGYVTTPFTAYLPEGYTAYGPAVPVDHQPAENGEVHGIGEGTIYTNPSTPDAVYIYTLVPIYNNASYIDTPHYVRFISEALDAGQNLIHWQGSNYRMTESVLDALPDGCVELGVLHSVGWDALPAEDLQTNSITYGDGRLTDGCTVYEGSGKLYVQISVWRDGGDQTAYKVWEK